MKKNLWMAAVAGMVLWCTGCMSVIAPEGDMFMKGRWGQMETYMEKRVKDLSAASTYDCYHLCYAYANLKKYNKLFPCLDRFEANVNKGDRRILGLTDVSFEPNSLRAVAYMELGDYGRAVEQAEKALRIVEERDLMRAYKIKALGTLSLAHALNANRAEALNYARRLEGIGTYYPYVLLKTDKVVGLAKTYMALGDYRKSLEFIEDDVASSFWRGLSTAAVTATGLITPDDSIFVYQTMPKYFIFARSLYETGKVKEAREQYDKLLQTPQTRFNGEIHWMALHDRGRIAEKEGSLKEAIEFYARAVDVIEEQRSTINTEASKIGFVGDKQAVYHSLVRALYEDGQYDRAFEYVERAKARALVDLLASKKDFALKKGQEQEIRSVLAMNDAADAEAIIQDASVIDKGRTRSIQIRTRQDLKNRAPELASLVTVTHQTVSDLHALIPRDEALIEYYYRGREMYAFILSDGRLKAVKLDSEGLAEDVQAFRRLVDSPSSTGFMEMAEKLYRRLFQPLESTLNKKHLMIVFHGALHYLPANALHDGKGYLIDRYSIRMMPSAGAMKYLSDKKTDRRGGILIFGNPDLGDPGLDLEYAQREAAEIARIRPASRVFVRKEATEAALRRYGSSYPCIHFATHGQFNAESPLKSALLLAPDLEHNGVLTVDKLYSLTLDADLVTLSACETGLSRIANGDDMVGLTRGFLYAGSRSIVASLWKVDDLATSLLMTRFYRELDKTDKREALRTAQLENKKKYPHPYYWASFQLTGSAQ